MITATATATEMQNNFGRYLNLVMSGQEIIEMCIRDSLLGGQPPLRW